MDMLDRIREEGRYQAQTDRLGLLQSDEWKAAALLLARMPAPPGPPHQLIFAFHPTGHLPFAARVSADFRIMRAGSGDDVWGVD
jgi:hypothetical protein